MGGKNSPMRNIPEQDPVQDALEKSKKTTYFNLTLLNRGDKLNVLIRASETPEQFLRCMSVQLCMLACKCNLKQASQNPNSPLDEYD